MPGPNTQSQGTGSQIQIKAVGTQNNNVENSNTGNVGGVSQ